MAEHAMLMFSLTDGWFIVVIRNSPLHLRGCRLSSNVAEFPSVLSSSNECNTDAYLLYIPLVDL